MAKSSSEKTYLETPDSAEAIVIDGFQLTTYPNPFSEYTNVSFSLENASLVRFEVYNFSRQKVISKAKEYPFGQHEMKISADHLKAGIYVLRVRANDQVEMMKVIVQY